MRVGEGLHIGLLNLTWTCFIVRLWLTLLSDLLPPAPLKAAGGGTLFPPKPSPPSPPPPISPRIFGLTAGCAPPMPAPPADSALFLAAL